MNSVVAIVLCTYNGEKYIREQIDSILKQSYKDIKLYISDDGSTDSTADIIDEYCKAFPRQVDHIRLDGISNGAWLHFLRVIQLSEVKDAEYVMLADQDDVWNENKVERSLKAIKECECRDGIVKKPRLVFCDSTLVSNELKQLSGSYMGYARLNPDKATFSHLLVQNMVTGAAMIFNHELHMLLTSIPRYCVMHDHWIALVAAAFGEIRFIDEALYMYRQHDNSVLGANHGGIYREVFVFWGKSRGVRKRRREVREQVLKNYQNMLLQAQCFKDIYGDKLDTGYLEILNEYLAVPQRSSFGRVYTILKYRITCDNWYRVIGQCSFFVRSRIMEQIL